MPFIMFTKHLQEYSLPEVITSLKSAGMDGADLCVRPGYPVTPENAPRELPLAAKAFADEGMSIPLVTTPVDFTEPGQPAVEPFFDACSKSGVGLIKLGYWRCPDGADYWELVASCRKKLEGFAALASKYSVKAVVHTHSGNTMGLNASAAMQLVEGFDPEQLGIFLDTAHLASVGEPLPMAFNIARKYVACIAFKDGIKLPTTRDGREIYAMRLRRLGEGSVDWHLAIKTILDLKLGHLPISIHCEYNEPAASVVDLGRIDLRFVKRLFADLGGK